VSPGSRQPRTPTTSRWKTEKLESAYRRGVELIRAGEYFSAHEELEDAWRAAPTGERDFFQGLVHVAVAWYQAGRGRRIGTERQLAKALRRLEPFAPAHRGLALEPLLQQLHELHERGSLDLPAPLLKAAEADRVEDAVERDAEPPVPVEEEQ
jgi:predicted metal-dependent hydrolase